MAYETYKIASVTLARSNYPTTSSTWTAMFTIGDGDTKRNTLLNNTDLRVLAAAATAIADSIERDHRDDKL